MACLRAVHVSGVRRDTVRTSGLRGEIFGHGRTKLTVESTRVLRRWQPSRDVTSMKALVGPSGERIVQIFHRYAPATIECSRGYRGGEHPRASCTKHADLAKARPRKWGSCPSLGLSARAFHVHSWKAQEVSASQTLGKTRINTAPGSRAQGCVAHASRTHVARRGRREERKKVAAFVCEDEPSGECS